MGSIAALIGLSVVHYMDEMPPLKGGFTDRVSKA
jgi:hypothetical protein